MTPTPRSRDTATGAASAIVRCWRTLARPCAALLVAAALLFQPSCGGQSPSAGRSADGGDDAEPGQRIVALSPAVAVMLRDLGLADRIVGRHDFDLVLPESVPAVGHQEAIDYEALLGLDPTHVVIEWGSRPLPPRLTEFADSRGWRLMNVRLLTLDDIARTLDDLAIEFGAASLDTAPPARRPSGLPEEIDLVPRFTDPATRFETDLPSAALARAWRRRGDGLTGAGRVLLLGATTPPGALGPGSCHHEILVRIGGIPAIDEGAPWVELDAEDILRLDPDAIVLVAPRGAGSPAAAAGTESEAGLVRERLGRIGELDIGAIRNGRLGLIDDPLALLPSTSMIGFAEALAARLEAWSEAAAAP